MSLPARTVVSCLTSATLVAAFTAPAAAHSGPIMRLTGMMNQPAMNRSGFMGGVGLMPYQRMLGTGGAMMNAYQPPMPAPQGSYGSGASQMRSYSQPTSPAYGYNQAASASSGAEAASKTSAKNPLLALRSPGGGLDWPVALRFMTRDDDAKELRERIDSRFEQLVSSKQGEAANTELLEALRGDLQRVRKQLKNLGDDFPSTRAQLSDARSFLDKVLDGLKQPTASSGVSTYR
jgi:hypothetical protein